MISNDVMNVAMEWVVTMKTCAEAEQLRVELNAWLLQDPRHRIAYARAERQWAGQNKAVTLLQENGPFPPETLLREIDDVARQSRRRRQVRMQARNCSIALAVFGACALVALLIRSHAQPAPAAWVHYVGGYGSPERHVLTDGSELYLNGNSAASVRMTQAAREVALGRGELLVRVKHDGERPFLVKAGETVLRAIGTLFSVRREATGDLEAIVQEGKVEIRAAGISVAPKALEGIATVGPGQTATISAGKVWIESHDPTEIKKRLDWVNGRLYLHGTLTRAVSQFNDHNERKLVIGDASIGDINVMGLYDCRDLLEFAESLRSRGVRYRVEKATRSGNDVIVLFSGQ